MNRQRWICARHEPEYSLLLVLKVHFSFCLYSCSQIGVQEGGDKHSSRDRKAQQRGVGTCVRRRACSYACMCVHVPVCRLRASNRTGRQEEAHAQQPNGATPPHCPSLSPPSSRQSRHCPRGRHTRTACTPGRPGCRTCTPPTPGPRPSAKPRDSQQQSTVKVCRQTQHARTFTNMHQHAQTQTRTDMHRCTHRCTDMYRHAQTCTDMHTDAHTRTHTR